MTENEKIKFEKVLIRSHDIAEKISFIVEKALREEPGNTAGLSLAISIAALAGCVDGDNEKQRMFIIQTCKIALTFFDEGMKTDPGVGKDSEVH